MSFGFGFFPLDFFFRSFVENPLSSRHILDLLTQAAGRRVSREEDDAGSSSFVVVGVFVLRFVSCERRRRRPTRFL